MGTIINTISIIIGGILGNIFGKYLKKDNQTTIIYSCAIAVIFIGIAGTMEGMLNISNSSLISSRSMLVVICLTLGAIIGEIIDIEGKLESIGSFIKVKSGHSKDKKFIEGFSTASFTVCIGAMAIVGSIKDGLVGDYSILATKSILDLIIIMILTSSLGKGCIFSAIPIFVCEGAMTLLAKLLSGIMTDFAIANISLIGSILIFCVGINLLFDKKISVANLLPSILLAMIFAFLPFNL